MRPVVTSAITHSDLATMDERVKLLTANFQASAGLGIFLFSFVLSVGQFAAFPHYRAFQYLDYTEENTPYYWLLAISSLLAFNTLLLAPIGTYTNQIANVIINPAKTYFQRNFTKEQAHIETGNLNALRGGVDLLINATFIMSIVKIKLTLSTEGEIYHRIAWVLYQNVLAIFLESIRKAHARSRFNQLTQSVVSSLNQAGKDVFKATADKNAIVGIARYFSPGSAIYERAIIKIEIEKKLSSRRFSLPQDILIQRVGDFFIKNGYEVIVADGYTLYIYATKDSCTTIDCSQLEDDLHSLANQRKRQLDIQSLFDRTVILNQTLEIEFIYSPELTNIYMTIRLLDDELQSTFDALIASHFANNDQLISNSRKEVQIDLALDIKTRRSPIIGFLRMFSEQANPKKIATIDPRPRQVIAPPSEESHQATHNPGKSKLPLKNKRPWYIGKSTAPIMSRRTLVISTAKKGKKEFSMQNCVHLTGNRYACIDYSSKEVRGLDNSLLTRFSRVLGSFRHRQNLNQVLNTTKIKPAHKGSTVYKLKCRNNIELTGKEHKGLDDNGAPISLIVFNKTWKHGTKLSARTTRDCNNR